MLVYLRIYGHSCILLRIGDRHGPYLSTQRHKPGIHKLFPESSILLVLLMHLEEIHVDSREKEGRGGDAYS